jgi:hypothetical protein
VSPSPFVLAVTILFAAAGCSATSGVSIVTDQQTGLFGSEEYSQDISRGDMAVVVRGSAFDLDQPALEKLVVQNMQGAEWGRHAHFAAATNVDSPRTYFYTVMVNTPRTITAASFCSQPYQPISVADGTPGELRVVTNLCRFDKVASSVSGVAVGVTSPNDPNVHALIAGNVFELTKPDQQRIDLDRDHGEGTQQHP